jgi:GH25 family lysozyme M1 (1,4-beta-N-acetylmuramidase)
MTLRDRILSAARACVGLGADPAHLAAFAAFLGGPGESPAVSNAMATYPGSSTCGLVVRALLRDAGIDDARLRAPYRIGTAISDLLALAREHGAWVDAAPGLRPKPGDVVGLALFGPDAGHAAHVFTVDEVNEQSGISATHVASIDGGQVDELGRQCVRRKDRLWTEGGGVITDGTSGSRMRTVSGWVDVDRLESATAISSRPSAARAPCMQAYSELIDLSVANLVRDYSAFARAGIAAAIVRSTLGRVDSDRDIDPRLHEHANGLRSAGLQDLTTYSLLFGRHAQAQDGARQGTDAVKAWRSIGATLIPFADVEHEPGDGQVTDVEYRDAIRYWVDAVEHEIGRSPGLYVGSGWLAAYPAVRECTELARCVWWAPDYAVEGAAIVTPAPCAPFSKAPELHQYAGGLAVPGGLQGRVGRVEGVGIVDRTQALTGLEALRV